MNTSSSIQLNGIVNKTGKYVERHLNDKYILKNVEKNEFFIFENISFDIYKLINGSTTIEKMSEILFREYDITIDVLRADICDFVADLIDADIALIE